MRKMFAKVLGVTMAAAMVVTTCTGIGASAATNYSLPVKVSYDNICEKDEYWSLASSNVGFDITDGLKVKGSANFNVGFTISVPKFLFKDKNNRFRIGIDLAMNNPDTPEGEDSYIGSLEMNDNVRVDYKNGKYEFAQYSPEEDKDISLNDLASVSEKGDFVKITMNNVKLRSEFWEDAKEPFDTSKEYIVNANMNFQGVHMTGDTYILVDKFKLNDGDILVAESSFGKDSGCWVNMNEKEIGETAACVSSDYLLKVAKTNLSVKKGKTVAIKTTVSPKASVKFVTSNKKIATVTSKGVVKGVKAGKAVITVTANGVSRKVTVTVKK